MTPTILPSGVKLIRKTVGDFGICQVLHRGFTVLTGFEAHPEKRIGNKMRTVFKIFSIFICRKDLFGLYYHR